MPETTTTPQESDDGSEGSHKENWNKYVTFYLDKLFKKGGTSYDRREVIYVLIAAVIVALNTGYINGVCMSPGFVTAKSFDSDEFESPFLNKQSQGVSGTGGSFTNTARFLISNDWPEYSYYTWLILSYIFGGFIVGFITPRAHKHLIEPAYGPSFLIGAILLLSASIFATMGLPSRFIFYFSTGAIGVQNGIASVYSANLIRCTLTGASTDLGLIVAQCLRGDFEKFIRGTLIAIIVTNYWIGGLISVPAVKVLETRALYPSAAMFFALACLCVMYTVAELGTSVVEALTGTWKWEKALDNLLDEEDDDGTNTKHSKDAYLKLFDTLDLNEDEEIEIDELRDGLERTGKVTSFRLKVLMRTADVNHDNVIKRDEWEALIQKLAA
jgi:hypothetical protein